MRIIRRFMALIIISLIITALIPVSVKAEGKDSNETKTDNNLDIQNGVFLSSQDKALEIDPQNFLGFKKPKKTEEELKREEFLSKYAEKINSALLPQGKFKINASAYTAAADECGKSDGITASGLKVKENETIACPPHFPFGLKIAISGMGTYVCEDRGGAIKGNHIDIYMEKKSEAFAFGRKNLDAEIVL